MAVKQFWSRASKILKFKPRSNYPAESVEVKSQPVVVAKKDAYDHRLELVQQGLSDLVGQLKDINQNLCLQSQQNQALMKQIEHLPDMIETIPEAVKNQSSTVKALLNQLQQNQNKDLEFIRAVEAIPRETGKQTDMLENIASQLSASAEAEVLFAENFNKFRHSLDHLDSTGRKQIEVLTGMNKAFLASDRYMKYLVSSHNKRFTTLFITSISVMFVCIVAVIAIFALLISRGIL